MRIMVEAEVIVDLMCKLQDYYTPEECKKWVNEPHPQLDGRTAIEEIAVGNGDRVFKILGRLQDCSYL